MALKSEITVLLSPFFLCLEIRLAGGISLASIFRFLNCRLGGEAGGDTMDSDTAGDVGGAGESGAAKDNSVDSWQYTADGMGSVVLGSGLLTRHCGSFFG